MIDSADTRFIAKIVVYAVAFLVMLWLAPSQIPVLKAQTASTEIAASSIDGGGGEMSSAWLTMEYAVAESQPVGESSGGGMTLESGFIPVIAMQETTTTSPGYALPIPAMGFWGLVGMLGVIAVLSVRKRRLI